VIVPTEYSPFQLNVAEERSPLAGAGITPVKSRLPTMGVKMMLSPRYAVCERLHPEAAKTRAVKTAGIKSKFRANVLFFIQASCISAVAAKSGSIPSLVCSV
jgi:hypothetical protein